MQPVILLRSMKRKPKPGLPRLFDRPKYRQRNIIERMFGWLKENRRIVTRFDKFEKNYAAMVSLACSMRCLRLSLFVQSLAKPAPFKLHENLTLDTSSSQGLLFGNLYAYWFTEDCSERLQASPGT
ncbi:hypothetical protein D3C76_1420290 [compost metagenome]